MIKRREFIAGLGAAAVWPIAARAQQADRVRRIGVLMGYYESDPEGKARLSGFTQGLTELGWTEGRNVRMEVRWSADNVDLMRAFAKEMVDLKPDVILASNTPATAALQRETRMIPIVFPTVSDPVGEGFIASISRPGGNITGLTTFEASLTGKWLQLLTEIAKAATTTIPVVFVAGVDPVASGLVASLNRPGANVTGIANLSAELSPKQLQLLREVIPNAAQFGVLADPAFPGIQSTSMGAEGIK